MENEYENLSAVEKSGDPTEMTDPPANDPDNNGLNSDPNDLNDGSGAENNSVQIQNTDATDSTDYGACIPPKKKRKKKKTIISVIVIVLILCAVAAALYFFIIPEIKYNSALSDLNNGEFEKAKEAFVELDTYRDSAEQVLECDYRYAMYLFNEKKYGQAINAFAELGGYADSGEMIIESGYLEASEFESNRDYQSAAEIFYIIRDYKDSRERLNKNLENYFLKQGPSSIINGIGSISISGSTVTIKEPSTFPDRALYLKANYISEMRELWYEKTSAILDIVFEKFTITS